MVQGCEQAIEQRVKDRGEQRGEDCGGEQLHDDRVPLPRPERVHG
jgi:hypothetical protein